MQFKDMYEKRIDRPIDAVVKAGSTDHLENELEEYVITSELEGHLLRFYDEYNDIHATGNGAWISGFFGSGKSHLLKILAVMLEDRSVGSSSALDYILPKVAKNPALKAAMETARAKHPSESILFNIDVVAPNQGRTEAAALLAAFIKVFNAHRGYFDGDQQHIAKLEYDLDREGKFERFKECVQEECGKPWEEVRKAALLYAKKVTAAFDRACDNPEGTNANIVSYYQQTYQPDIESFAHQVKEYIEAREAGFRLNFFVDEVGQFIAQNTNLMVNLQSVAEELNTACGGASWVIVTSQENMDSIVGQMRESAANDFSKIQARFKVKMQLTSKDAQTVIKQRLLAKSDDAVPELADIYARNKDDFRVLFDFADGSRSYLCYQDEQDFVDTYPFVPYQFDLFITAMRGLSDYNAFTGRHHSTGARSMLGVFQDVGTQMAYVRDAAAAGSTEKQSLAPFDAMFEGLRNSLKSEAYAQITLAETHLQADPLAVRVLKALFLVKYCRDFKATPGNLRVLLFDSLSQNTSALEQRIKDVLAELERQVYVRRNGNVYEYLTDEEKDIEEEIRATAITVSEMQQTIAELYRDIVGPQKAGYRNGAFEHSFAYNLRIDGDAQGQQRGDLSLDIVTELSGIDSYGITPTMPKTLSVTLQNASSFLTDVRTFKQTQKYTNVHSGTGEVRAAIVADKRQANNARYSKMKKELEDLLTEARYNAGGVEVTSQVTGSGKDAVASGMQELIRRSYTGLQQLNAKITDNDVYQSCLVSQGSLDGSLPEYVETVFTKIGLLGGLGAITAGGDGATSLISHFAKNEFGWPDVAVRSALARLYAARRIEVRKAGSLVEGTALAEALKRNQNLDKLVVSKMDAVPAERLAQISQGYRAVAGNAPQELDAKAIAAELSAHIANLLGPIEAAASQTRAYPFAREFEEKLVLLRAAATSAGNDWKWVVSSFPEKADEIAAAKKDLSAMQQFASGSGAAQKWLEIKRFRSAELPEAGELGLSIASDQEAIDTLFAVLEDPGCYKSKDIPRVAGDIKKLRADMAKAKSDLRTRISAELDAHRAAFEGMDEFQRADEGTKREFTALYEAAKENLAATGAAHRIKGFVDAFSRENNDRIAALLAPVAPSPATPSEDPLPAAGAPVAEAPATVRISDVVRRVGGVGMLRCEQDVDAYLASLKQKIMAEISAGRIVM